MKINVFFCDDIRKEEDGRRTYVGVFNNKFKLREEKELLPRFFAMCELILEVNEAIPSPSPLFIIKKGDNIIGEFEVIQQDINDINVARGSTHKIEVEITPLIVSYGEIVYGLLKRDDEIIQVKKLEFIKDEPKKIKRSKKSEK